MPSGQQSEHMMRGELRQQTLYELDDYGNRTAEIRVVGKIDSLTNGEKDDLITRYSYRLGGLVDEIIDPDGKVTKHDYDAYGRLTQIDYDYGTVASPVVSYAYEATNLTGQQDAVIDEEGVRTDYEYDALNRIVSMTVTEPGNVSTTTYEYDAMGNLTLEADAAGVLDQRGHPRRNLRL